MTGHSEHGGAHGSNHDEHENPIKKFYRIDDKVTKLLDTTKLKHADAFVKAAEAVLKDENGLIDYKRLDEDDNQVAFVDKITEEYVAHARKALKVGEGAKLDETENDMLLTAYMGITKGTLKGAVSRYGSGYTIDTHKGISDKLVKEQEEKLRPTAHAHLKTEHLDDIISHTQAGDKVLRDRMKIEDGVKLLRLYKAYGVVPPEEIKKDLYYKKPHTEGHEHGGHAHH